MLEAHLRDSVPLAQTLHWLEQEVRCGTTGVAVTAAHQS